MRRIPSFILKQIQPKAGPPRRRRHDGFSLIEIVLCLGIIGFAMVAIFGLLPVGLNTFRSAMDASVETRIFQSVVNDANQMPFDELDALTTGSSSPRYYDEEGKQVTANAKWLYKADIALEKDVEPLIPWVVHSNQNTPESLYAVRVDIERVTAPGEISRYTATIADMGQ